MSSEKKTKQTHQTKTTTRRKLAKSAGGARKAPANPRQVVRRQITNTGNTRLERDAAAEEEDKEKNERKVQQFDPESRVRV